MVPLKKIKIKYLLLLAILPIFVITTALYTDGVTEAMNEKNELFSEGRLITVVTASEGKSVQETIDGVMGEIGRFSLNTPQADDITMMMIRFNGTG